MNLFKKNLVVVVGVVLVGVIACGGVLWFFKSTGKRSFPDFLKFLPTSFHSSKKPPENVLEQEKTEQKEDRLIEKVGKEPVAQQIVERQRIAQEVHQTSLQSITEVQKTLKTIEEINRINRGNQQLQQQIKNQSKQTQKP